MKIKYIKSEKCIFYLQVYKAYNIPSEFELLFYCTSYDNNICISHIMYLYAALFCKVCTYIHKIPNAIIIDLKSLSHNAILSYTKLYVLIYVYICINILI